MKSIHQPHFLILAVCCTLIFVATVRADDKVKAKKTVREGRFESLAGVTKTYGQEMKDEFFKMYTNAMGIHQHDPKHPGKAITRETRDVSFIIIVREIRVGRPEIVLIDWRGGTSTLFEPAWIANSLPPPHAVKQRG